MRVREGIEESKRNMEWDSAGGYCGMRKKQWCTRYAVATYRCWAMTLTNGMIRADGFRGRRPMQYKSQAAMTAARGGLMTIVFKDDEST